MDYANEARELAVKWHTETNHKYDRYLPYEFHLRMVNNAFKRFAYLVDGKTNETEKLNRMYAEAGCWLHDTIEDCRITWNDLRQQMFPVEVCDLVYAVSNEKGKNRAERANAKYYNGIRKTPLATFVKLCDRIANVEYSRMMGSDMLGKYRMEYGEFREKLYDKKYKAMFDYIEALLGMHKSVIETQKKSTRKK
jgi:(p)ppGpp synthase/HD superfamily hydrolase